MIEAYAKKHNIDDFENMDLINQMTVEGLNYDFFGDKNGKPTNSISEKDFDISVNEQGKNYRILGFIDKLFLFKRKKTALIRDFKTSKQIFNLISTTLNGGYGPHETCLREISPNK